MLSRGLCHRKQPPGERGMLLPGCCSVCARPRVPLSEALPRQWERREGTARGPGGGGWCGTGWCGTGWCGTWLVRSSTQAHRGTPLTGSQAASQLVNERQLPWVWGQAGARAGAGQTPSPSSTSSFSWTPGPRLKRKKIRILSNSLRDNKHGGQSQLRGRGSGGCGPAVEEACSFPAAG